MFFGLHISKIQYDAEGGASSMLQSEMSQGGGDGKESGLAAGAAFNSLQHFVDSFKPAIIANMFQAGNIDATFNLSGLAIFSDKLMPHVNAMGLGHLLGGLLNFENGLFEYDPSIYGQFEHHGGDSFSPSAGGGYSGGQEYAME